MPYYTVSNSDVQSDVTLIYMLSVAYVLLLSLNPLHGAWRQQVLSSETSSFSWSAVFIEVLTHNSSLTSFVTSVILHLQADGRWCLWPMLLRQSGSLDMRWACNVLAAVHNCTRQYSSMSYQHHITSWYDTALLHADCGGWIDDESALWPAACDDV